jgi:hypothetical protein
VEDLMDEKIKIILFYIVLFVCGIAGGFIGGCVIGSTGNRTGIGADSGIVDKLRQLDISLEEIDQQFRTGIEGIQTGITELKGLTESTEKRTGNITAGIGRLEKGTGKAVEYSESVVTGLSRIEGIVAEMGRAIEDQGLDGGGIGAGIREQVEILRKELDIKPVGDVR